MRRTTSLLILAAAFAIAGSACSRPDTQVTTPTPVKTTPGTTAGPDPSTPATSATPLHPPTIGTHGAFAQCLSEHGAAGSSPSPLGPAPGPASAPPGVDAGTWDNAMQACAALGPGPAG